MAHTLAPPMISAQTRIVPLSPKSPLDELFLVQIMTENQRQRKAKLPQLSIDLVSRCSNDFAQIHFKFAQKFLKIRGFPV